MAAAKIAAVKFLANMVSSELVNPRGNLPRRSVQSKPCAPVDQAFFARGRLRWRDQGIFLRRRDLAMLHRRQLQATL
jgi:hypothetical protein